MNSKDVMKLIQELSNSKGLMSLHRVYCEIAGNSLPGGMFIAQCLYWTGKGRDPDGWFYKTYDEWKAECFMSKHEVKKYADMCAEMGFLETEVRKVGRTPKLHYRINFDAFAHVISTYFSQPDFPDLESQKMESQNLESQKMESPGKLKNGKSMESEKMESPIYTSLTTSHTTTPTEKNGGGGSVTVADAYNVYQNEIGSLTAISSEQIGDMCDEFTPAWFVDAVKVAVKANTRRLTYIEGILKRWHRDGKSTGTKAQAAAKSEQDFSISFFRTAVGG